MEEEERGVKGVEVAQEGVAIIVQEVLDACSRGEPAATAASGLEGHLPAGDATQMDGTYIVTGKGIPEDPTAGPCWVFHELQRQKRSNASW